MFSGIIAFSINWFISTFNSKYSVVLILLYFSAMIRYKGKITFEKYPITYTHPSTRI